MNTTTEHVNDAPVDDLDAWINGGSRPHATVDVCLAGDVYDEHARLVDEVVAEGEKVAAVNGKEKSAQTMGDRATVRRAHERIDEIRADLDTLREKMTGSSRTFRMEALSPQAYRMMQVRHSPRDGDPHDKAFGVNVDTFFVALVEACTVEPALTTEQWSILRTKLSPKQWDDLWGTAHALNRRELVIPKSQTPSEPTASSDGE